MHFNNWSSYNSFYCNLVIFFGTNQISAGQSFFSVSKLINRFETTLCSGKMTQVWYEFVSLPWLIVNNLLIGLLLFLLCYDVARVLICRPNMHIFLWYIPWKGCCFRVEMTTIPLPNIHPNVWVVSRKRQNVETSWLQLPLWDRW